MKDNGTIDGVPSCFSGSTRTGEWLEQKLPDLLDYRLVDFRVHAVAPATHSAIPAGREIVVIDIGDSTLAPHQSRRETQYYYRSGSHSLPAPHFYLELLRQRLTNASLDFSLRSVNAESAWLHEGAIILRIDADFIIENTGRIAAYKWSLIPHQLTDVPEDRAGDYLFSGIPGSPDRATSLRVDDTILPGASVSEQKTFGVRMRPATNDAQGIRDDLVRMFGTMALTLQLPTETSPGQSKAVDIGALFSTDKAMDTLAEKGLIPAYRSHRSQQP